MSDDMLKTIETLGTKSVSRRGFLRGGAIAAAIIGAAAAAPAVLHGQSQDAQSQDKSQDKKDPKDGKKQGQDQDQSSNTASENKVDAQGREYRECPQCGGNMYQQGRTWTCENCGYSYVE